MKEFWVNRPIKYLIPQIFEKRFLVAKAFYNSLIIWEEILCLSNCLKLSRQNLPLSTCILLKFNSTLTLLFLLETPFP
jgi:hypothetical protein